MRSSYRDGWFELVLAGALCVSACGTEDGTTPELAPGGGSGATGRFCRKRARRCFGQLSGWRSGANARKRGRIRSLPDRLRAAAARLGSARAAWAASAARQARAAARASGGASGTAATGGTGGALQRAARGGTGGTGGTGGAPARHAAEEVRAATSRRAAGCARTSSNTGTRSRPRTKASGARSKARATR